MQGKYQIYLGNTVLTELFTSQPNHMSIVRFPSHYRLL